jgi:hypothetical protein
LHGPQSFTLLVICVVRLFVLFYILFVCKFVLPRCDNPIAVTSILYYLENSWFQTFALFCMLYTFFWVIPRRLSFRRRGITQKKAHNILKIFENFETSWLNTSQQMALPHWHLKVKITLTCH